MTGEFVRPYGVADLPAPTGHEASALDRDAHDRFGIPGPVLMEVAGRCAAHVIQRVHPDGRIVALTGRGNNGGDAVVAARTLAAWGRDVVLALLDGADHAPLLHGWRLPVWTEPAAADLRPTDVVVDGLLGTGLRGPPRPDAAAWMNRVGPDHERVVALDVPSGVDANTGAVPGAVLPATLTIAFGAPKLGSLLHPARAHAGRLVAMEIGFPPWTDVPQSVITPAWFARERPRRTTDTHKYAVGAVLLVAGREGMAGAAVLAGRAALRAGVGLLRIASPRANREILQRSVPEAVFVDREDAGSLEDALEASAAAVAGPGMGTDEDAGTALAAVLSARARGLPLALDADALTLLGERVSERLPGASDTGGAVLLTPHAGEMRRLDPGSLDASDRVDRVRALAAASGATVLLKGAPSLVGGPSGHVRVGALGSSDLATAGMGDVLAGACGALLAAGADAEHAGALALHLTGRAARRALRGPGLLPSDVIEEIGGVWTEEGPGDTDLGIPGVLFDQDAPQ